MTSGDKLKNLTLANVCFRRPYDSPLSPDSTFKCVRTTADKRVDDPLYMRTLKP